MFYEINEKEVDYYVKISLKPEIDFILPLNAFDTHEHSNIKEYVKVYATLVVIFIDVNFISYLLNHSNLRIIMDIIVDIISIIIFEYSKIMKSVVMVHAPPL